MNTHISTTGVVLQHPTVKWLLYYFLLQKINKYYIYWMQMYLSNLEKNDKWKINLETIWVILNIHLIPVKNNSRFVFSTYQQSKIIWMIYLEFISKHHCLKMYISAIFCQECYHEWDLIGYSWPLWNLVYKVKWFC